LEGQVLGGYEVMEGDWESGVLASENRGIDRTWMGMGSGSCVYISFLEPRQIIISEAVAGGGVHGKC
jgi:hypothetical protein